MTLMTLMTFLKKILKNKKINLKKINEYKNERSGSSGHQKVISIYKEKLNHMSMPTNNYCITCECGSIVVSTKLSKHEKTKKHICFIQKSVLCAW